MLGRDWAKPKVLTLFSFCPAPTPFPSSSQPPAPSLIPTFPTCLPIRSAPRPLVLDPADPTWNVGQGSWELLAQQAAALGTQACLRSREGVSVQPWNVMVRGGSLGWRMRLPPPPSCLSLLVQRLQLLGAHAADGLELRHRFFCPSQRVSDVGHKRPPQLCDAVLSPAFCVGPGKSFLQLEPYSAPSPTLSSFPHPLPLQAPPPVNLHTGIPTAGSASGEPHLRR